MSKSLGNFARIIDLIDQKINPLAYRLFVLNTYYRKTADFSMESIMASIMLWIIFTLLLRKLKH
jgi:cysteinyl-tRNA synthetase